MNELDLDLVEAMASSRRLDAVDVAVGEFTRPVRESRSCRDSVVPTQAIGGPVGTAIMGNWMVTPEARRNRGLIYGTWTTHQYLGNIIAPVIIVLCNISHAKWWWGLMWPVFINAGWGLVCHFALPATPEAHARKEAAEKAALTGTTLNTVPEEPAKRGITIKEALQIPSVAGYCIAFGFMKTINYVLFFWCGLSVLLTLQRDAVAAMASS